MCILGKNDCTSNALKVLETTHQVPFHMNTFYQFSRYILIKISSTEQNISECLNSRFLYICVLVCIKDRRNILHFLLWMFDVIAYQGYRLNLSLRFILSQNFTGIFDYLYQINILNIFKSNNRTLITREYDFVLLILLDSM